MSNTSNLFKGFWVNVDENDKRIIDNNELAEKKIEQYNAAEARRLAAENEDEDGDSSYDGFEEGIGYDQVDAFDESQNIIGANPPVEEDDFSFLDNPDFVPMEESMEMDPEMQDIISGDNDFPESFDEIGQEQEQTFDGGGFEDEDIPQEESFENDADFGNETPLPPQEELTEQQPQINLEEIQSQIDEQIRMAEEQAKQIVDEANEQAEAIRNQAEEEGRSAGYEAGLAQGAEEAEQLKANAEAEIEEEKKKMQADFQNLVNSIEPDMVEALTAIYEHVFNVEFRENKDIILHLIKTTLGKMDSGVDIILHVSSDDYDLVSDERVSLEEAMASPNSTLEIIEDPLLKENECILESEGGVFDCSLGVELSELSRKLKLLSFDRNKR